MNTIAMLEQQETCVYYTSTAELKATGMEYGIYCEVQRIIF